MFGCCIVLLFCCSIYLNNWYFETCLRQSATGKMTAWDIRCFYTNLECKIEFCVYPVICLEEPIEFIRLSSAILRRPRSDKHLKQFLVRFRARFNHPSTFWGGQRARRLPGQFSMAGENQFIFVLFRGNRQYSIFYGSSHTRSS